MSTIIQLVLSHLELLILKSPLQKDIGLSQISALHMLGLKKYANTNQHTHKCKQTLSHTHTKTKTNQALTHILMASYFSQ